MPTTPATTLLEAMRRLVPRRTYRVSQTRAFALTLLLFVSIIASTLVIHAGFFAAPTQHGTRQQRAYHAQLYHHHDGQVRQRPLRPNGFSFAQHPGEELGALVAFLSALASNSLPLDTNAHSFLDPDLVLEFDTRTGDDASIVAEVQGVVADAWARNPVVVFSELSSTASPASREMKGILAALDLNPSPTIFELDKRVDGSVLRPLVQRLTHSAQLPILLIGGTPMSLDELKAQRDSGVLKERLARAGATLHSTVPKHGRKADWRVLAQG